MNASGTWKPWKRQPAFYLVALLLLLALALLTAIHDRGWMVLWFADHRSAFLNQFFTLANYLGDGWFIAVVVLAAGAVRLRNLISLAAATIVTALVVQFLKRVVFHDIVRPSVYFGQMGVPLDVIDGVALHSYFSFPSGHAAGAFALFLGLALLRAGVFTGVVCAIAAMIAGLSRVYLGQHFAADVIAGAVISVLIVSAIFMWFRSSAWYRKTWAKYSLLTVFLRAEKKIT